MAETKKAAKAPSRAKAAAAADEVLPSREEAVTAFSSALVPNLQRVRERVATLAERPPQLLHVEGGELNERVGLALWWAALLNCENVGQCGPKDGSAEVGPCLACPSCLRIGAGLFADLVVLDGREGSIKIDQVRELRPLLGEAPRFGRKRVVIVLEAQSLGIEAANSLLKSLEEPCPDSCFLFTMPQRERLLPTLVSRGWVLTLPWPDPSRPLPDPVRDWALSLAEFVGSGRGWFERTSVKGALDAALAQSIVLAGQKALAERLTGRENSGLGRILGHLPDRLVPATDELFAQCQEALQAQVNPALVMDRMATELYLLTHERA